MNQLNTLSDQELVTQTQTLRSREKKILYALLLHLGELDERRLYRDEGYSSFFSYLEVGLGYSKAAAYRRVQAARFLREKPELYAKLTAGELSFSALVELSKISEKENLPQIVEKSVGKSHEEVASLVQLECPKVAPKKKETIRAVKRKVPSAPLLSEPSSAPEPNYQITFEADEEFMALYREAKAIAGGHSIKEVFAKLLKDYTQRKSPKHRTERRLKRQQSKSPSQSQSPTQPLTSPQPKTRHIPQATKDQVYLRDRGQCTYTSPTGTRCTCKQNLEYDHFKPYALGGESTADNLRLLCRAHNQLMAETVLGKEFMESKRGA